MASYRDIERIGSGGFGEVWVTISTRDELRYAKKVLGDADDPESIKRFRREVRIQSQLDHPNIVRVLAKQLNEKPYYYIMPLYSTSLRAELPALVGNQQRIGRIFTAILDGLEYAHAQGVIHRDLKPENVLLNGDTDTAVSDFGLGRILSSDSSRVTFTGAMLGTPFYMAPEQLQDAKRADRRADIFALGRILYEMNTGPMNSSVQDLSRLAQSVALIVSRCTMLDPGRRFQSVSELKQAWHAIFDPQLLESDLDEVASLRTDLSIPEGVTSEAAARLLELLSRHDDDVDLIHDTFIQLHPSAIRAMHAANTELTRQLLYRFLDFAATNSWPFDYTDRIANQCSVIYDHLEDWELRAYIVRSMLQLGVSHSRWHVLGVFSNLLARDRQSGEDLPLIEQLRDVDETTRKAAAEWVRLKDISPSLRPLFRFDEIPF